MVDNVEVVAFDAVVDMGKNRLVGINSSEWQCESRQLFSFRFNKVICGLIC